VGQVREKLVRCLWFDQFLEPAKLLTEDGRKVSVFSPGYWNQGAGPDFHNAEISFGEGERLRGDVEVHVNSSGWERHGHRHDQAYERVVLHVVLYNDLLSAVVFHGSRGIPQLVLSKCLSRDLAEIVQTLNPDGYPRVGVGREGTCCRSIRAFGRDQRWVGRFLDIAGDERVLCKAEHFERRMIESTPDDVLYEALMETMGYSANRRGFRHLAHLVSLAHLRRFVPLDAGLSERLLAVQALLLGGAGFLETAPSDLADPESAREVTALREVWDSGPGELIRPRINPSVWQLKRTRPTNHPVRRIAGIAAFLAAHLHTGLCRALMTAVEQISPNQAERVSCRQTMRKLRSLFEGEAQGYWARRTTFGSARLSRPARLIGSARATEMVVNVIVPVLLALSRREGRIHLEHRLHNMFRSLPPVAENSATRYMKMRMFGGAGGGDGVTGTLRRQQGLLQIFHDFCESEAMTCEECGFLAAVEGRAG